MLQINNVLALLQLALEYQCTLLILE